MKNKKKEGVRTLKIGLDLHGVGDEIPEFWSVLSRLLVANGHEFHILTGAAKNKEVANLKALGIVYTHFFSITDHHKRIGTKIVWDKTGDPHLDPYLWDKAKGEYAKKHRLDIHFDDSDIYDRFFKTPYARFYSKRSTRVAKLHI